MESATFEVLLTQTLGKGLSCFTGKGNEQNLLCRNVLHINEVTHFSDGGHRLAATGTADDQHIILQRHHRLPLLGIKRISQNGIEVL